MSDKKQKRFVTPKQLQQVLEISMQKDSIKQIVSAICEWGQNKNYEQILKFEELWREIAKDHNLYADDMKYSISHRTGEIREVKIKHER